MFEMVLIISSFGKKSSNMCPSAAAQSTLPITLPPKDTVVSSFFRGVNVVPFHATSFYFLSRMGKPAFIMSGDVEEKVVIHSIISSNQLS
jgi:hypothetical protein